MRPFKIQTLSDRSYSRLGDPITVITGSVALLSQLFPNIFGGTRRRLTEQDWLQIIPGNGYWTSGLRNYLKGIIKYDTDVTKIVAGTGKTNLEWMTYGFVTQNKFNLYGPQGCSNFQDCMPAFYEILKKEAVGGGQQTGGPPGYLPGVGFSIPTEWLLIGAGVLVVIMSKKRKRRK
jgi:hypothetical protein